MGTISRDELARWENVEEGGNGAGKDERIFVSVRVRPLNDKEIEKNDPSDWECVNNTTILYKHGLAERSMYPAAYSFDRVFGFECSTRNVYDEAAKEVALSVLNGINSSVFAYGQTSSGKTYTMTGITEYFVSDIYEYIEKHEEREFLLKFSAMEIYNEAVRDLLSADTAPLRLLDDPEKGTTVEKLTEETLRDRDHLNELLAICEAQRQIGETSLNEMSSRSHQILRLTVESSARQISSRDSSTALTATVNFVDLAGSERASQAMSAGTRLKEGCHINRSLLTLGTVVRKLSKGRNGHIPYRDSKLTRILQSSLGGNARTAIICTLSPARSHLEQSRNTLLFASCAKEISTNAQVNVVMSDKALVKRLQRELARLENEIRYPGSVSCSFHSEAIKERDNLIKKMEREIKELVQQRDLAQSRLEDLLHSVGNEQTSRPWDESSESSEVHVQDALLIAGNSVDQLQSQDNVSLKLETSEMNSCNQGHRELSEGLNEQPVASPSHSNRLEEISDVTYEDSEEDCKEVRCVEEHSVSMGRNDESVTLLLPMTEEEKDHQDNETPFINNETIEEENFEQEKPIKYVTVDDESRKETYYDESSSEPPVEKLIDFEVGKPIETVASHVAFGKDDENNLMPISNTNEPEMWKTDIVTSLDSSPPPGKLSTRPAMQKLMSSRRLALTRSRSCKASLMNSSIDSWFDTDIEDEDNKTPPKQLLNEISGRTERIHKSISALNFDADENDKASVEDSETSDKLSSIPNVSSMQDIQSLTQEQVANFSYSLGGIVGVAHSRRPSQLSYNEEAQNTKVADGDVDTEVKDVCAYQMPTNPADTIPTWEAEFEKKQLDIIELWHVCNISLVHRTCFFLLFKGDRADSFYIEVEFRRLSFLRNTMSNGKPGIEDGHQVALASSMKHLRREREILYQQLLRRFSQEEKISLYKKWGIDVESKQRRLQLSRLVWTKTDIEHVRESASLVAKLIGVLEQGHALKEMFGLSFTPQRPMSRRSFSWKHGKSPLM